MPTLHVETSEREKPLLFLVGEKNPLIALLAEEYSRDFKVAHVTNSPKNPNLPNDVYLIKPDAAPLIKNLEEKIGYAIIFLEDDAIRKYIEPVLDKLDHDEAKTAIILNVESQDKFYDIVLTAKKNPSFYFFFAGDIYSDNPNFNKDSETRDIITSAIRKKNITLSGNDLKPIFPIYYKDAIIGISHILFGPLKKQKFYYLFYSHPQTYISAIHILERIESELRINYKDQGRAERFGQDAQELANLIQSKIVVTPEYLDRYLLGFERSIANFQNPEQIPEDRSKIIDLPKKVLKAQKLKINFVVQAAIISVIIFVILNIVFGVSSILLFKNSISELKKGDYQKAAKQIYITKTFLDFVTPITTLLLKASSFIGFADAEKNYFIFIQAVNLAYIGASDASEIGSATNGITRASFDEKLSDAFFLYFQGVKLASETKNETPSVLLTPDLPKALSAGSVADQIFGYNKEKHYLILFENNGELRPDGGFIGSVGNLYVKNGKIEKLELQDVYEFDGQLKAHVEPYYIIRRYLQPHLYLRDSNFDPDFQTSAATSALIYNLETGKKVDGVIAINFEAVKRIIQEIGPIKLSSYNQTLDEENTFDFLEKTIDNSFFPGSTQKKDVLQALFNQLILKLEDKNSAIKIAKLIPRLADEKQILFAFNENSIQSIFNSIGFGGEYRDPRKADGTVNDFIAINEANIGVNKVNTEVKRSTDYEPALVNQKISSSLIHRINNGSDKEYKSYIRFFVPKGSNLISIKIDDVKQKLVPAVTDYKIYERKKFKPPAGLEVDNMVENDLQVFGFIISVPPKSNQIIEVTYNNGIKINDDPIVSYSLYLLKQPGTLTFPFTLKLNYGAGFTPKLVKNAELAEGNIVINEEISTDREIKIELTKR